MATSDAERERVAFYGGDRSCRGRPEKRNEVEQVSGRLVLSTFTLGAST